MSSSVLLCTVGGSHQPIVKSIRSISWLYVCFFCTDNDPETGKQGSLSQVTCTGNVIKARRCDTRPTLPNIPRQAGLDEDRFEHRIVPADDLDGAVIAMRGAIGALAARFPAARFVADYTGGTKTMTAALVCVALERDDVALQLVTGARPDLDRVTDGTEQAMTASVARLRLDLAMAPYLAAWRRYAYDEAAAWAGSNPHRGRRPGPSASRPCPGVEPRAGPVGRLRPCRRVGTAGTLCRPLRSELPVDAAHAPPAGR